MAGSWNCCKQAPSRPLTLPSPRVQGEGKSQSWRWLAAAGMAVVVGMVLYAPLAKGMWHYYRDPYVPTLTYGEFIRTLPRMAMAGQANAGTGWLIAPGGVAGGRRDGGVAAKYAAAGAADLCASPSCCRWGRGW